MTVVEKLTPNADKTQSKDYEITFPRAFGELPKGITDRIFVIATIELTEGKFPDAYTVNVFNITSTGFIARVTRIDANEGWGMDLELNYLADRKTMILTNQ